jgi:hypothetical protein
VESSPPKPLPARLPVNARADAARATEPSFGRFLLRLTLELLVVFIGVYAAFALSEHRAQRESAERRDQLQLALIREIEGVTENTRRAAESAPRGLAALDSMIAAGERPPLQPMLEPVRFESHMWEATLQSGGLELFPVPLVYRMSEFYNHLNMGFEQLAQLRSLSETVLVPHLGEGPDEFYDPATGRLRPKYHWYPQGIRNLGSVAAQITEAGDALLDELRGATAASP